MSKIDWKKDMKDTTWAMFWIQQNAGKVSTEGDKIALKENVARLIRMATQKTAGQRKAKGDIDWNAMEHTVMTIVLAATSLCLHGEFGDMPETIDEAD